MGNLHIAPNILLVQNKFQAYVGHMRLATLAYDDDILDITVDHMCTEGVVILLDLVLGLYSIKQ